MKKTVLIFSFLIICAVGWGQAQSEDVAKRMTANLQKLREYSWSTQTEVRVKGQQVSVTLEKVRYDIDGNLQVIPLGGTGKLSPELQPVVAELAELGLAYSQPEPKEFAQFFSRAELWEGKEGTLRIEGQDFLRSGDLIDIRVKNDRPDRLSVETLYGTKTQLSIGAEFRALTADGPNYVARLEVSVPEDEIDVLIENFDYVYNAPVAASDVSILPAGTELVVRLSSALSSKQAKAGQEFQAVLDKDLVLATT